MLEQQLNETRVRKQIEISEIDGRLNEQYEAKMEKSMSVSKYFLSKKVKLLVLPMPLKPIKIRTIEIREK